jgi:hypothetical protein
MKKVFKHTLLASAMMLSSTVLASELFIVPHSTIYQVVQNQSLKTALAQVAQRSGITFKIDTDLGNDKVNQTLSAADWTSAVKSLLVNYNFTLITDGKVLKTVLVTGHKGLGEILISSSSPEIGTYHDPIVISQTMAELPKKYDGYPAGSVLPISFPVKELMALGKGEKTNLETPLGNFNVSHDTTDGGADGSNIWTGHLANEGLGYRMMLSQGEAGTMGHITTPEGTFNIESTNGSLYLIDTNKLASAGYEGDQITAAGAVSAKSPLDAVTATKVILDAASQALYTSNVNLKSVTTDLATRTANMATYTKMYNTYLAAYNNAKVLWVKAESVRQSFNTQANITAARTALSALATATANYNAASANVTGNNQLIALDSNRIPSLTAIVTANQKAYDLALSNYNSAMAIYLAPPPVVVATTANSIIDIMVEYTANNPSGKTGLSLGYTPAYAKQRVAYLVAASNQAYSDSGAKVSIRLVYAEQVAYTDVNNNSNALLDLSSGAGVFASVEAKRTQYGADLVYLFRPLNAATQKTCGVAYVEMMNSSAAVKSSGYGVISDGSTQDNNPGTYCAVNTFTHEIGHNMGLVHDREYSNGPGAYPYSYAWGVAGQFGTIMSYKAPVVMYFSSPALAKNCANVPCGYAETDAAKSSDQVKSLNLSIGKIAAFNPTKTTLPVIK